MTEYTRNRGYPYPKDAKECGNGGLHSELLARAVALDLDALDAAWTAAAARPSIVMVPNADGTNISSNVSSLVINWTTEKQVGTGIVGSGTAVRVTTAPGWFHVTCTMHTRAEGAITANAQHRIELDEDGLVGGSYKLRLRRYATTFQAGSNDVFNSIDCVTKMDASDQIRVRFFHTNTASNGRIVVAGTRLIMTRIRGL